MMPLTDKQLEEIEQGNQPPDQQTIDALTADLREARRLLDKLLRDCGEHYGECQYRKEARAYLQGLEEKR